ncbi:MAG TPA: hypothetical protein VGQ99_14890 [Tepidisphaeraceae bacterium]|jgi:hypothetical protein|nr:hypothetical protein [Tepidisphaeraceae bacterium]
MKWSRTVVVCLLGTIAWGGCTQKQPEPPAPQPAQVGDDVIAAFRKKHPDAQIGRVIAVRPEDRLVAVGDMPVADFKRGDVVVFVSAGDEHSTGGEVVDIRKDTITVRYAEPTAGQRPPKAGDLMVRFKK